MGDETLDPIVTPYRQEHDRQGEERREPDDSPLHGRVRGSDRNGIPAFSEVSDRVDTGRPDIRVAVEIVLGIHQLPREHQADTRAQTRSAVSAC